MKKFNILVFTIFCIILFSFYKYMNISFKPQILPRKIDNIPLKGSWVVDKYIFIGSSSFTEDNAKEFLGKKAVFNDEEAYFNNEVCKNPNFKIKLVDTKDYFWSNFKIKPSALDINIPKIKIITVSSNNTFYHDYIQLNDDYIIKEQDGLLLFLKKEGTEGTKLGKFNEKNSKLIISNAQKDIVSKSGFLLGLKHKTEEGYEYRTLWIDYKYGKFYPIKECKDILVPRKKGFYIIGTDKVLKNDIEKQVLIGSPINKDIKEKKNNININTNIIFVGNEYIALDDDSKEGQFEVKLIDNIYGNKVAFSKAFGKEAGCILKRSAELYLRRIGYKDKNINEEDIEYNWGIVRRSGRWMLRGRVEEGDFDITYATPKILTTYDDLYPSFDNIKEKIPQVIDAYTSPNKDFIVVLTAQSLLVCPLENKYIGEVKLKLDFKENESVVMSQWCTGNYVDEWGKIFEK